MTRQSLILVILGLLGGPLVSAAWNVQHLTREVSPGRTEGDVQVGPETTDDPITPPSMDDKESEADLGLSRGELYKEPKGKWKSWEGRQSPIKELEEEFHGGSQRDEIVRMMEKLLSLPNPPHFHFPPAASPGGVLNYANEKTRNPSPSSASALQQRFLLPRESVGDNGHGSDPLSTSANQLLQSIYEHQGMKGGEGSAAILSPPPMNSLHNLRFYSNERKRNGPNSGYICHFKLCQFGSSGKRIYKPHSRSMSVENEV